MSCTSFSCQPSATPDSAKPLEQYGFIDSTLGLTWLVALICTRQNGKHVLRSAHGVIKAANVAAGWSALLPDRGRVSAKYPKVNFILLKKFIIHQPKISFWGHSNYWVNKKDLDNVSALASYLSRSPPPAKCHYRCPHKPDRINPPPLFPYENI